MMTCFETPSKVLSKSVLNHGLFYLFYSAFLTPSDVKEICNHFIKHFLLLLCHSEFLCVDLKKKFGLFAENVKTFEDIKYKCIDKWFNV